MFVLLNGGLNDLKSDHREQKPSACVCLRENQHGASVPKDGVPWSPWFSLTLHIGKSPL